MHITRSAHMQLVIALMSIVLAKVAAERPTAGKIGGDCRENHWTNTKLSTMTASNGAIGFDTTETPGSDYTCDDPDNVFCAMPQPAPYPNGGTIPRTCMKLPPTNSDGNYFDGKYCVTFEEYGNLRPGYVEVLGDGVAYLFRACGGYQWCQQISEKDVKCLPVKSENYQKYATYKNMDLPS